MANPLVRPHLHFYPQDSGTKLGQAWEGARWLRKMDPNLPTPMIRISAGDSHQDFYIFEPAMTIYGTFCLPHRWFVRQGKYYAKAYTIEPRNSESEKHWVIREDMPLEVYHSDLQLALPLLEVHNRAKGLPSPHCVKCKYFYHKRF